MVCIFVSKEKHISLQSIKNRELRIAKTISLLLLVPLALVSQITLLLITKCLRGQHLFNGVGTTLSKERSMKEVTVSPSSRATTTIEKKFFDFLILRKS